MNQHEQFADKFIKFYQDMRHHSDVVNQVLLSRLYDEACDLQHCGLGESIKRVIKTYKIKPAKNHKKISKINK